MGAYSQKVGMNLAYLYIKGIRGKFMHIIIMLLMAITIPAFADSKDKAANKESCNVALTSPEAAQERLLGWMNTKAKKANLDNDPATLSQQQANLRRLFIATESEYLQSIFQILSKDDLFRIGMMINTGELKVNDEQKTQMNSLLDFVKNDAHDVLWDKDGAMAALNTKYPEYRGPGYQNKLGGVIGGLDTSSLTSIEKEILKEAMDGSSDRFQRGGWLKRFWSPQYFSVSRILKFFNWVRQSADHIEEVGETLKGVVEKSKELQLTNEQALLVSEKYNAMTIKQRAHLRKISETVFGQDIFTGGYQQLGSALSLHRLGKIVSSGKIAKQMEKDPIVDEAEASMDLINQVINEARTKQWQKERVEKDFFAAELKVRHRQYSREADAHYEAYTEAMGGLTNEQVEVNYEWEEARTRKNSKGEDETYYVTRSGSKEINVTYADVILENFSRLAEGESFSEGHSGATITEVDGLDDVRANTMRVRVKEGNLNRHFNEHVSQLKNWIEEKHIHALSQAKNNPQVLQDYLTEIQIQKTKLAALFSKIKSYSKMNAGEVKAQWSKDNFEHFQKRTKILLAATEFLISLYEIYYEQVRRSQYELVITPDLPDYSTELNKLKWAMIGNYTAKTGIGVGVFAQGIACTPSVQYYGWTFRAADACVNSVWGDLLNSLLALFQ